MFYFLIPHMDPPVSLKCVFYSETTHGSISVITCVFFLLTTTRVISCVFFSHTTYGSTSVIEMCVLFRHHTWIHQSHCMCVLFTNKPHKSLHVYSFHEPHPMSLHVCSPDKPHMDPPVSLHVCSSKQTT